MSTSESQLRASKAYRERHKDDFKTKYKKFTITLPIEEYNHAQEVIKSAGTTPTELFRRAIKRIEHGEEI